MHLTVIVDVIFITLHPRYEIGQGNSSTENQGVFGMIDHWRATLRFTEQLVERISLNLLKAKIKANMAMHASHIYTCYSISLDPTTI